MTIDEVKFLLSYIINKEQSTELTPDEFNSILSMAQRNYISYLLGSFQQYQPGRPQARVELGNNAVVRQRLTPAIYSTVIAIGFDGYSQYPDDYLQTDAMLTYGRQRVRYVEQDRLWFVLDSVIDPVATNPVYTITDTGFNFYPSDVGFARLSYVRNPPNMVWGYVFNTYGQAIYDVSTSVQPIWGDLQIFEIIARALSMVGINLQAGQISAYAQEIKNTGQ
jgi:hypothetical protein